MPPSIWKGAQFGPGTVINNVWYAARWALSLATEIHILGYSLPPSDFEADALIREGLYGWAAAPTVKKVIVVNKDTEVVKRFMRFDRPGSVMVEPSAHDDVADHLKAFLAKPTPAS